MVTAPWFKWVMAQWDSITSIKLIGEPRMAPAAIIVLLYMLFKARQPTYILALVAAFFYNIHPILIVGTSVGMYVWSQRRRPKGYVSHRRIDEVSESSIHFCWSLIPSSFPCFQSYTNICIGSTLK